MTTAAVRALKDPTPGVAAAGADPGPTDDDLRKLTGRILNLYDNERRGIARELHDTTAQNLAALAMSLAMLSDAISNGGRAVELLAECTQLTEECVKEVRSLSYLLHPPLLDELGLASALRSFVEVYERRTGVTIEMRADALPRFTPEAELAAFRVAQEALANVHRHSGQSRAELTVEFRNDTLTIAVRDWGRGIDPSAGAQIGAGLAGVRERVRLLEGALDVRAAEPGTLVRATFPVKP